jgi:hypothetical protein
VADWPQIFAGFNARGAIRTASHRLTDGKSLLSSMDAQTIASSDVGRRDRAGGFGGKTGAL